MRQNFGHLWCIIYLCPPGSEHPGDEQPGVPGEAAVHPAPEAIPPPDVRLHCQQPGKLRPVRPFQGGKDVVKGVKKLLFGLKKGNITQL